MSKRVVRSCRSISRTARPSSVSVSNVGCLHDERDLRERIASEIAAWRQCVDQALERHVLVIEGAKGALPHAVDDLSGTSRFR